MSHDHESVMASDAIEDRAKAEAVSFFLSDMAIACPVECYDRLVGEDPKKEDFTIWQPFEDFALDEIAEHSIDFQEHCVRMVTDMLALAAKGIKQMASDGTLPSVMNEVDLRHAVNLGRLIEQESN